MPKILKNTTGLDISISDTGVSVPASSQITLPEFDYPLWSESSDITTPVTAGDIVVNDGVADLGVTDGLNFLKYPDTAFNIRFLGEAERSNLFTAKNVQEAIEQGRNSAIGTLLNPHFNATGNNIGDKWLGHNNPAAPSNNVPWVTPQNVEVKGVTFSNSDTDADTDIEIYVNGVLQETVEVRNYHTYYTAGTLTVSVLQGQRLSVFLRKVGLASAAPSNPSVGLFCKVVAEVGSTGGE